MNYRHVFHAGNFADLIKHAVLLQVLGRLTAGRAPVTVIDTHAGAGVYDLRGPEAKRSGEAEAGVVRLMAETSPPGAMRPLVAAVRALNSQGEVNQYPGSPWLIAQALRPGDGFTACELRPDDSRVLRRVLNGRNGVSVLQTDGYAAAAAHTPAAGPALVLIDPPFERPDDYTRLAQTLAAVRRRNRDAWVMAWLPLKDLETFDSFLRDVEDRRPGPLLVAEVRLRPLTDPGRMNGCALVMAGVPADLDLTVTEACAWVTMSASEGGEGRTYRLM